jgi:hypothetical protein
VLLVLVVNVIFIGFLAWRVPHEMQELLTFPERLNFSWVGIVRSSVFCVMYRQCNDQQDKKDKQRSKNITQKTEDRTMPTQLKFKRFGKVSSSCISCGTRHARNPMKMTVIALSVFLRFRYSDCPFGIFKIFLGI